VRNGVDTAVQSHRGLSDELREQYLKRLEALDRKEGYFLDLAAEEGWPKDKLRSKINTVRQESAGIRRTIEAADARVDVGQQIFHDALALLDQPGRAYRLADEHIRAMLNKAFFTRLYVDGGKIAGHDLREPFDKLIGAYEEYVIARTSALLDGLAAKSAEALTDSGARNQDLAVDSNALTWWVSGWSTTNMVGITGFEPVTSAL
jgi:hypothetical protein